MHITLLTKPHYYMKFKLWSYKTLLYLSSVSRQHNQSKVAMATRYNGANSFLLEGYNVFLERLGKT